MRISEAFDLYRDDYIRLKNQSKRTEEIHDCCKRLLMQIIGDIDISELTLNEIRDWREELLKTRCINGVRVYIIRLRAVLGYLNIRKLPALDARLVPVPQREPSVPAFFGRARSNCHD